MKLLFLNPHPVLTVSVQVLERFSSLSSVSKSASLNALHLYSAFIQSTVQLMLLIHPFTYTFTIGYHAKHQPACKEQFVIGCLAQGQLDTRQNGIEPATRRLPGD